MRFLFSTVKRGALFEKQVQTLLAGYRFDLRHVGTRGDLGVDLRGWWSPGSQRIPVVAQCKNFSSSKITPAVVRELDAVLDKEPLGTIGFLFSPVPRYTSGVLSALHSSRRPLSWGTIHHNNLTRLSINQETAKILPSLRIGSFDQGTQRLVLLVDGRPINKE